MNTFIWTVNRAYCFFKVLKFFLFKDCFLPYSNIDFLCCVFRVDVNTLFAICCFLFIYVLVFLYEMKLFVIGTKLVLLFMH